jgi:DNA mismatch endonuclease (patch repair protein)
MPGIIERQQRSNNMSRIRSKDTKPEMIVRKFLFSKGFRFRLHDSRLPGKPDVVLPKYKVAIQIQGCFWHAHSGCRLNRAPKSRPEYWGPKIAGNVKRDQISIAQLRALGWRVIEVWECSLSAANRDDTLISLCNELRGYC